VNDSERQQLDLFLDGDLSDAESAGLLTRLEDDPQAVAYLAERALLHNDLRRSIKRRKLQQWAVAQAACGEAPPVSAPPARSLRLAGAPLAAAIIGLFIGFVTTSLVLGVMSSGGDVHARSLLSEGFEDAGLSLAPRFPEVHGVWNGTRAAIVPSTTAAEGARVIRFGPIEARRFCYLNRIIDVSELAHGEGGGQSELRMTVKVRPARNAPSTRRYRLRLAAFAEDPAAVKDVWFSGGGLDEKALSFASRMHHVDGAGWATMELTLPLPPDARNVVLSIGAGSRDADEPNIAYEADAVTVGLVTTRPPSP